MEMFWIWSQALLYAMRVAVVNALQPKKHVKDQVQNKCKQVHKSASRH